NFVTGTTRSGFTQLWGTPAPGLSCWKRRSLATLLEGFPGAVPGPEFISKALDRWAHGRGIQQVFIRPGKPVENAYIESFNGCVRDECLNLHWF
ncbi:transposase, partial [Deinococcus sp. SDU3-2]|nr:transposase [Deinococcus terrestris]